jgi:transcriptional regulator with XRE-family HTH domain
LADKTELSARTIQRIESGEVDPRAYSLQMIAKALDVEYSIFMETSGEDNLKLEKEEVQKQQRILAWLHFSGFIPLFIPSAIVYYANLKKASSIDKHFKDVIEFQLTIWLVFVIPGSLMYFFFNINNFINKAPFVLILGLLICMGLSFRNAFKVLHNDEYKKLYILKPKKK